MGENTRKFNAMINSRYGLPEKDLYNKVVKLAEDNNIAKSRAQILLVEKGLGHKDNPHPLETKQWELKPKVVIKKEVVYRDKPPVEKVVIKEVEKIVYKDRPEQHITEHLSEPISATETGLRPAGDQQSNRDVNASVAIDKKQSRNDSNVGGWILGLGVLGVIVYGLIKSYTW